MKHEPVTIKASINYEFIYQTRGSISDTENADLGSAGVLGGRFYFRFKTSQRPEAP